MDLSYESFSTKKSTFLIGLVCVTFVFGGIYTAWFKSDDGLEPNCQKSFGSALQVPDSAQKTSAEIGRS